MSCWPMMNMLLPRILIGKSSQGNWWVLRFNDFSFRQESLLDRSDFQRTRIVGLIVFRSTKTFGLRLVAIFWISIAKHYSETVVHTTTFTFFIIINFFLAETVCKNLRTIFKFFEGEITLYLLWFDPKTHNSHVV